MVAGCRILYKVVSGLDTIRSQRASARSILHVRTWIDQRSEQLHAEQKRRVNVSLRCNAGEDVFEQQEQQGSPRPRQVPRAPESISSSCASLVSTLGSCTPTKIKTKRSAVGIHSRVQVRSPSPALISLARNQPSKSSSHIASCWRGVSPSAPHDGASGNVLCLGAMT